MKSPCPTDSLTLEILGHALLSTTAIYTHVSIDQLKAVHAACHPGATNIRHRSPTSDMDGLHDNPDSVEEEDHDHPVNEPSE